MTEQELNRRLKQALDAAAPDDLDGVLSRCAPREETVVPLRPKRRSHTRALIAACLTLVLVGGAGGVFYQRANAVASVVSLDVNPSIELRVNKAERVITAEALNKDAEIILEDMKLKGVDVDVATNAIIGSMVKNGYLSEFSNSILLTVESDDHQKSVEVTDHLTNEINAALDSFGGSVIAQQVVSDNDLQNMAGDYGISEGKAALIRNILNELPMLKAEDLAEMSINDLNLLASSKQISLSNTTTTGSASESGYIGTTRAEEIALEHAGITSADTDFINTELDCDGGIMEYEVNSWLAEWNMNTPSTPAPVRF